VTRLVVAIVLLAVVGVITRRKVGKKIGGGSIRITARAGISRGAMAAVIEAEDRRFLVTITPSSTTVVAELDVPRAASTSADDALAAARSTTRDLESLHASLTAPAGGPASGAALSTSSPPAAEQRRLPLRTPGRSAISAANHHHGAAGAGAGQHGLLDRARRLTLRSFDAVSTNATDTVAADVRR
jgi:hypothetical protein